MKVFICLLCFILGISSGFSKGSISDTSIETILDSINFEVTGITIAHENYDRAYYLIDSALNLGYANGKYQKLAPIVGNYSVILEREGRYRDAINCLNKLMEFHTEMDSLYYGILLSKRGIVYSVSNEIDLAYKDLTLAIEVLKDCKYKILIADAYVYLSQVNRDQNELFDAVQNFKNARNIYVELGMTDAANVCSRNISNIYCSIDLYDEAIEIVVDSKNENEGVDKLISNTYLLNIYEYVNREEEEKRLIQESLELYYQYYDSLDGFYKYDTDSKFLIYLLNKDSIQLSYDFFHRLVNSPFLNSREVLDCEDITEILYYYIKTKNKFKAEELYNQYPDLLYNNCGRGGYDILQKYADFTDDILLQNKVLKLSTDFHKNINRKTQISKMTYMYAKFDSEKKEKDLEIQRSKVKLLKKENTAKNRILVFSSISLFLIIVIFIFVFRTLKLQKLNIRNEKEILRLETIQLSNEILTKDTEISKIESNLNDSHEQIENLKETIDFDAKLNKTKNEFFSLFSQEHVQTKNWEDFKNRFDKIPSEYFEKLLQEYPQLTASDKKLCVLIKVNMSSKEIANILLISPKSVDQKKYRLKKKIAPESDEELSKLILG